MTREEAIDYFEQLLQRFEKMREEESSYWGKFHTGTTINAIAAALSALRAPVQEQGIGQWYVTEAEYAAFATASIRLTH